LQTVTAFFQEKQKRSIFNSIGRRIILDGIMNKTVIGALPGRQVLQRNLDAVTQILGESGRAFGQEPS
jgi:hypothetical protein